MKSALVLAHQEITPCFWLKIILIHVPYRGLFLLFTNGITFYKSNFENWYSCQELYHSEEVLPWGCSPSFGWFPLFEVTEVCSDRTLNLVCAKMDSTCSMLCLPETWHLTKCLWLVLLCAQCACWSKSSKNMNALCMTYSLKFFSTKVNLNYC